MEALGRRSGEVEMLTAEQLNERRHDVNRAINVIEQDLRRRGLGNGETQTMIKRRIAKIEVAEVYSPPRVTEMAKIDGNESRLGWT